MKRFILAIAALTLSAPGAHATPLRCASECSVQAIAAGYVVPVTEIASGARVRWTTTELSHPTTDSADDDTNCFNVGVGASTPTVAVRFVNAGGGLTATTDPGGPNEHTEPCGNARALPTGELVLPFHCMLHNWMNGVLVVDP
jgi:hypothetical protein